MKKLIRKLRFLLIMKRSKDPIVSFLGEYLFKRLVKLNKNGEGRNTKKSS